jgi:hypothetical protein
MKRYAVTLDIIVHATQTVYVIARDGGEAASLAETVDIDPPECLTLHDREFSKQGDPVELDEKSAARIDDTEWLHPEYISRGQALTLVVDPDAYTLPCPHTLPLPLDTP